MNLLGKRELHYKFPDFFHILLDLTSVDDA